MTPMLFGPDGRVVNANRVKLEKQTRFNPTKGLRPDIVVQRLEQWARGEIAPLSWTMDWVEKHDDVCSVVADKARRAVSRYGWEVLPISDLSPEDEKLAETQAAMLKEFYRSLVVRHAVDSDERGRFGLLARQMMDAYGQMYSAHHVVWKPGKKLEAELIKVPLWQFENKEGRMAWLDTPWAPTGKPLEQLGGESAWLIAKSRGVMLAGVIAFIFKHIPLQDWLTYCDRHGMPGFLGKTASEYGQPGWNAIESAVRGIGAEYGAVINASDAIEVLDLTAQGAIPYPALVDRMDRAFTILWRGGDLGTISRGGESAGALNQNEEVDDLDADNSMWLGETLDMTLGRRFLEYHMGEGVPMLCELRIGSRTRDDQTAQLAAIDKFVGFGGRVSQSWFAKKFGIAEAREDEDMILGKPTAAKPAVPGTADPQDHDTDDDTDEDPDNDGAVAANARADAFLDELSEAFDVARERVEPLRASILPLVEQAGTATDSELQAAAANVIALLPNLFDPGSRGEISLYLADAMGRAFAAEVAAK